MTGSAKLSARAVSKVFEAGKQTVVAIDNLSLEVADREFISIIGTSGCGKSTFLNIVAGLTEASSGVVLVDGRPITGPGLDRGMVFQTYTLFPWLTALENIIFALKKRPGSRAEKHALARRYLELVGLTEFANSTPAQLSGGMKQRVAIARALVARPALLLMDEPFGALDAQTRGLMQELLLRVWEASGTTVLFITHDIDEAIFLSDRVYVMTARPGRIKAELPVPLPRPRAYTDQTGDTFVALKRQIMELIRAESLRSIAQTEHGM